MSTLWLALNGPWGRRRAIKVYLGNNGKAIMNFLTLNLTGSRISKFNSSNHPWAMHHCALCIFTKSGALSNQANHRCIAHAGYFDKLQDNKHLRENPTNLREKPYCLLPQLTVSIFFNLLIPKNNPDFFENNQATACTEYLANTPPMWQTPSSVNFSSENQPKECHSS